MAEGKENVNVSVYWNTIRRISSLSPYLSWEKTESTLEMENSLLLETHSYNKHVSLDATYVNIHALNAPSHSMRVRIV